MAGKRGARPHFADREITNRQEGIQSLAQAMHVAELRLTQDVIELSDVAEDEQSLAEPATKPTAKPLP
jgi:hypothetical protein